MCVRNNTENLITLCNKKIKRNIGEKPNTTVWSDVIHDTSLEEIERKGTLNSFGKGIPQLNSK